MVENNLTSAFEPASVSAIKNNNSGVPAPACEADQVRIQGLISKLRSTAEGKKLDEARIKHGIRLRFDPQMTAGLSPAYVFKEGARLPRMSSGHGTVVLLDPAASDDVLVGRMAHCIRLGLAALTVSEVKPR